MGQMQTTQTTKIAGIGAKENVTTKQITPQITLTLQQ